MATGTRKLQNKKAVAKHRVNYHLKMREFIRMLKTVPCADCGIKYPYYVMEFDHRSGTKKFSLGRFSGKGIHNIMEEVMKCEIVCSNCHKIREHDKEKS